MRWTAGITSVVLLALAAGCGSEGPTAPLAADGAAARAGLGAAECVAVSGEGIMSIYDFAQPITLSGGLTGVTFPGLLTARFTTHGRSGAMHGAFDEDLWVTNLGTFTTRSNVVFVALDAVTFRWSGRFEITSGAKGFLVQKGTLNSATGTGALTYHGRICP